MDAILRKVKRHYHDKCISAQNFHCEHYRECKKGDPGFIKAREPFVGTKYSSGGTRHQPRILFISLDPGRDVERTAEASRLWAERKWDRKGRNKHWFQTHALAWEFLKQFKFHSALTREQLESYFANADPTIKIDIRKHIAPYFAHTNSARCSRTKQAGHKRTPDSLRIAVHIWLVS